MKLIFVFGICDGGHVHPISVRSNGSRFFPRARLHEIHFSLSICSLSFGRYSSRTNDIDTGLLYSEDYCLSALPLYRLYSSVHLLDWFFAPFWAVVIFQLYPSLFSVFMMRRIVHCYRSINELLLCEWMVYSGFCSRAFWLLLSVYACASSVCDTLLHWEYWILELLESNQIIDL